MSVEEDRMDEILDVADLARELYDLKVKYERLKDGHRKLVSVNQSLEDKLLQNINRYETDKFSLVHNISTLNLQLEELQRINQRLLAENERFKADISVAIQLLHCRPSTFSSCKLESLPAEFQSKAKFHMQQELNGSAKYPSARPERKAKVIRVPISAFPSTTVIYSVPGDDDEGDDEHVPANTTVSASVMAKVLEERQRELHYQIPNGSDTSTNAMTSGHNQHCSSPTTSGLHPSRSLPFLGDGHHVVDHGTQTYPNFIGEREQTRKTCIFCQGVPSANSHNSVNKDESCPPAVEPKVYVFTESETAPMTPRSLGNSTSRSLANRRKVQNGSAKVVNRASTSVGSLTTSVETEI